MAYTTHASNYEVVIVNLMNDLVVKSDEAVRCQEIIDRLSAYNNNEKLSADVVDFIGHYAPIEIIDQHGMTSTVLDLIKKALDGLMKAIVWIINKLKEIFKYLFDSQFRAKKEILDLQRRIFTITMKADVRTKFENLTTTVHAKKDVDAILYKSQILSDVITSAAGMTDVAFVDNIIKTFGANAGITLNEDGVLFDSLVTPPTMKGTTFSMAGWTIDGVQNTIVTYLGMIDSIQKLREVQSTTEKAASDLKRRAEDAATSGATSGNLIQLQKEAAAKIMATKIMGYSIAIMVRRSDNILAFLTQIYKELHDVATAKA